MRKTEEEREVVNCKAHWLREEWEVIEAKCKKAEQENEQLRKKMKELQVGFTT